MSLRRSSSRSRRRPWSCSRPRPSAGRASRRTGSPRRRPRTRPRARLRRRRASRPRPSGSACRAATACRRGRRRSASRLPPAAGSVRVVRRRGLRRAGDLLGALVASGEGQDEQESGSAESGHGRSGVQGFARRIGRGVYGPRRRRAIRTRAESAPGGDSIGGGDRSDRREPAPNPAPRAARDPADRPAGPFSMIRRIATRTERAAVRSTPTMTTPSTDAAPPLVDRATKEAREARDLAPWALPSATSVGRRYPEPADPLRTVWERDRDRIVHCSAFRRLMYKTQVFINRQGDHQRTRLSHSLEVAQVARSVGNALALNEPLCEGLALAHDIGHPPFGHRGEAALDRLMKDFGGFRHNAQVLRVVDLLERRSPDYPGLNLTREFRESLLKHESSRDWPDEFGDKPRHPLARGASRRPRRLDRLQRARRRGRARREPLRRSSRSPSPSRSGTSAPKSCAVATPASSRTRWTATCASSAWRTS